VRIQRDKLDTVIALRRVWEEQFVADDNGKLRFRSIDEMPSPADLIISPYDPEARYSTKRGSWWPGLDLRPVKVQ